ncbi:MAG: hypothetical protein FRX49_10066 [Trebouxia sp. A1-2]|nr:MAG: hypothetical protein FRX49_10066 [Trebouxia sp. A1-2]
MLSAEEAVLSSSTVLRPCGRPLLSSFSVTECKDGYQGVTDIIPHKAYGRIHMAYFGKPSPVANHLKADILAFPVTV